MKKVLAIVAVLALTTAAQAALFNIEVVDMGKFDTNLGPASVQVYQVKAVAPTANFLDFLAAIDITVNGELFQQGLKSWQAAPPPPKWVYTTTPAFDPTMDWSPYAMKNYAAFDTHVMFEASKLTVPPGQVVAEDHGTYALGMNDSGYYFEGVGTYLRAVAAIANDVRSQASGMVQIAVPVGTKPVLAGEIANGHGQVMPFSVEIPEPATMGLLAIGALGLIARRRRS